MSKRRVSDEQLASLLAASKEQGAEVARSVFYNLAYDLSDARIDNARLSAEREGVRAKALEEAARVCLSEAATIEAQATAHSELSQAWAKCTAEELTDAAAQIRALTDTAEEPDSE